MKRTKKTIGLFAALLAFTMLLTGCAGFPFGAQNTHTVTFDLNGGALVSGELEQKVQDGAAAVAPVAQNEGYELAWDKDFSNVTIDMTITAQWQKRELSATEVAELVQKSTVTVNCTFQNNSTGTGSGFFIDSDGTIVTSYHVIEYATAISVEMFDGGRYEVDKIVAFNELNDLAILKVNMTGSPGLTICSGDVKVGETVYANGSALGELKGTFTSGTVSNASRLVNGVTCIQMDAAISPGNSGGPLVNSSGEVVGVNAMSYVDGENLNLAIRIENLDDLTGKVNYSLKAYEEWIMKESDRSYSPYIIGSGNFYYSTVNTYTNVTGRACSFSVDFDESVYSGYVDMCEFYVYDLIASEVDSYVDYLKTKGFEFDDRESYSDGVSYYYSNEWSGMLIDMFQTTDGQLYIWAYYY